MRYLRRISTRRLLAICGAVGLVAIASAAIALAATGGGPTPPPKPLPVAVHDALSAPGVAGISARVQFTDNLLPGSGVQGSDPLLTGGSGRLWASSDGKLRLELQSDSGRGDSQVVIDGRRFLVYSGDTRPCPSITKLSRGADLLIHEATFTEDLRAEAIARGHSTAAEAARTALEAGVKRLALTHISPRHQETPGVLLREACAVFPASVLPNDLDEIEVPLP